MFKTIIVVFILLVFVMVDSRSAIAAEASNLSDMEHFMNEFLRDKVDEEHIPNLAVSVVSNGEIIFEKGYGFADIREGVKVDPETTMFRIGSVSKLFTWTAIMQLVEQGKLSLNTDINQYLDVEIPEKLAVGSNQTKPKPITLMDLMTHTPGFEDYSSSIFRLSAEEMPPLSQYVREYRPERIFPAGEVLAYSNYGTALAGYIVEHVSGMPYAEYVKENIFKPLEMDYSTFRQPLPKDFSTNLAQAYRYIDGEFKEGNFEFVPAPAGGMSSTATDMATFMQVYLEGGSLHGEKILEKDTVQQMFQQQFTHHTLLDGVALGFMEKTVNGKRILHHAGSTALFDTGLYLLPQENIGLFISYSGHNYLTHTELFQAFMDHYFPIEKNVSIPSTNGENTAQYVGEYHQNRKSITNADRITSLIMGTIQVQLDKDGYLLVTQNGVNNQFVEIEPGIYQNTRQEPPMDAYGEFNMIVFQTDSHGNTMITTDGPMTYSKAPWYASSGFTFSSLILVILFFLGSIVSWGIKALIRRKTSPCKRTILGKGLAIATGLLLLLLVVGVAISGEVDPIYQLPKEALGITPVWMPILDSIPYLLTILGITMLILTISLWRRRYWSIFGRLYYSLLSILNLYLIWIFWYWNLY
ncbi:serine hydrolase domain-containing protein [Oceanobacillus halophilus]|uniref:Class A beta-lactamase-related serine hydrolase n=1 Tax=Oceanobacillus halophilus TaxID=930130 RepID=A0A495ADB0_9BACI|nr:serine hydrolase domain-containing protein [Oceanobacillus halophilus]RKQ37600.1 class A beta-lactamase-related serine hydrolase [Oceanobacillus halophilus]